MSPRHPEHRGFRAIDRRPASVTSPISQPSSSAAFNVAGTTTNSSAMRLGPNGWGKLLDGKLHVVAGTADSYYLDGSVRRLQKAIDAIGGLADFTYVPGASHSMGEIYARGGDRNARWKQMTAKMYSIARPSLAAHRSSNTRQETHDLPR